MSESTTINTEGSNPGLGNDSTSPKITEKTKEIVKNLVPQRSRLKYETAYNKFNQWRTGKNIKSFSESTLLSYFQELSVNHKPTSLWATYSMLRSMIQIKHRLNIYNYSSLITFLRQKNKGYKSKKSKVLSAEHINKFLEEAPDNKYLAIKVALIFGVLGACRRHELCNLTINDLEDKLDMLLVRLPISKTDRPRLFVVTDDFYQIYKKYAILRPKHVSTTRFFLNYRDGKCSQQVIGVNSFGSMPKLVAVFLKLHDPKSFTGHTFRRTSATLLADSGSELFFRKKGEDSKWTSNQCLEAENEDFVFNKTIDQQIAYSISRGRKATFLEKAYQTNLNNKLTTSSFDSVIEDEKNLVNPVPCENNGNDQKTTQLPTIKDERNYNNESSNIGSQQTELNEQVRTQSSLNIHIKQEYPFESVNLDNPQYQTDLSDQITTKSPINIYIGDGTGFKVDGLNALSNSSKNIHFHFSNCSNISIFLNKDKSD